MNERDIIESAENFLRTSPLNQISEEKALKPEYVGMKIFDPPIFAFAAADDEIFGRFKKPGIIGEHHMMPNEYLPGAKSVISFYFPYTQRIKTSNARDYEWPSGEWLHGRIEGQTFIAALSIHLNKLLTEAGYESLVPAFDERYRTGTATVRHTSNWSERHAAFACGLGTFGLSKGLITKKGTCGRFGSIITELELPSSGRPYEDAYEYCIMCGTCIDHCPAHAITEEKKDDAPCSDFLGGVIKKHEPWYGCGKCQVDVPCESGAPGA